MRPRYEILWDNLKKKMNDKDLYELISEYDRNNICRGMFVTILADLMMNIQEKKNERN